ncbi:hypothetical protein SAMCCGM7_pA0013 (plasmid) [Sinorhizobium americanum CCGM7]|uniref:DUF3800 domain-containing protein n=1 Tax=Sinorhizobium americanum TaxID=194963 RepID=UPI0004D3B1D8|nr:DUF3800 domain-containing protein [Sinorhizobium americanum]APG86352.1 hypothetical protein SAMCCGM7_pA0013 [Sinorhizobium americanum CCGM7]
MGESKLPFFAFVDETGNTGHNVFDEVQPDFLTAALISRGNFDTQYGPRVSSIAAKLGHSALHGKELGLQRIESIAGDLLALMKASRTTFFVSRVEKKYLLVTKMFDSIFDSGENAGISWHHYNMRPLRLMLTFKLSYLIEDETARSFWKCILEPKEARAREGLVKVCGELLESIALLPDEGSRKVLGDALVWARDHPEAIQIHVDRKIARQGHFPNLVAFTNLLRGLEDLSKRFKRPVARITHDQQSEFEITLKTYHDILSTASDDEIRWAGETYSFQAVKGSTFETKEDNQSAGIQVADVILWLYHQHYKKKALPRGCQALLQYVFTNGWEADFSFAGVEASYIKNYLPILEGPIAPEALERGRELIRHYELARLSSMAQYEADGLPPFMRQASSLIQPQEES